MQQVKFDEKYLQGIQRLLVSTRFFYAWGVKHKLKFVQFFLCRLGNICVTIWSIVRKNEPFYGQCSQWRDHIRNQIIPTLVTGCQSTRLRKQIYFFISFFLCLQVSLKLSTLAIVAICFLSGTYQGVKPSPKLMEDFVDCEVWKRVEGPWTSHYKNSFSIALCIPQMCARIVSTCCHKHWYFRPLVSTRCRKRWYGRPLVSTRCRKHC